MSGIGESFTCARCGGTFEKTRNDEEAMAEASSLWTPETMADEQAVICDPCFREFMAWTEVNAPEALREPPDPIGEALRADAEAAREEIRAASLICPSCGQNYADLIGGHCLVLIMSCEPGPGAVVEAECRDGQRAICGTFDEMEAAASISVADEVWRRDTIAFARDWIGTGPAEFTGLLSILEQP